MNLSQLKQAFSPLSEIGHLRKQVNVLGLSLTMRTLTSKEDSTTMEYLDLFRKESLARSIIRIGEMSLEEAYVETGEKLPDGTPVKIKKSEAVADVLDSLSRAVLTDLFTELTQLTTEAEEAVEKLRPVKKDPEEEKRVLLARLAELEQKDDMDKVDAQVKEQPKKVAEYAEALDSIDKQGRER
jgi:hypothetical protein